MNRDNGTASMSLKEYQLDENMRLVNKFLIQISKKIGRELVFSDCCKVVIEDGKVFTTVEIPEYIDFQKKDFTEFVERSLEANMINEIADNIKKQMKEAMK